MPLHHNYYIVVKCQLKLLQVINEILKSNDNNNNDFIDIANMRENHIIRLLHCPGSANEKSDRSFIILVDDHLIEQRL